TTAIRNGRTLGEQKLKSGSTPWTPARRPRKIAPKPWRGFVTLCNASDAEAMRILLSARIEVEEAAQWYEAQRAGLGLEFIDAVQTAVLTIEANPGRFAALETNDTNRKVHRYLLKRFPYVLIYEFRPTEIVLLSVAHARRRPGHWKRRT